MDTTTTGARDIETVVIGAGQAGLSAGYHLRKKGREFVILDSYERVGDNWRCHWDSLRLYSPALAEALPGMKFPAARTTYPTKDQMADFLETYCATFDLPVRGGVRVSKVSRDGERYVVTCTRRLVVQLRQRRRRDRDLRPDAERAGLRRRAGPGHPPAALERLQAAVPAAARRGAGGRGVALRRRHRLRGRHGRAPGGAQRADPRPGPVPAREAGRQGRLPGAVLPGQARAHHAHADRAQDAPGDPRARRAADPGEEGRPRRAPASRWRRPAPSGSAPGSRCWRATGSST